MTSDDYHVQLTRSQKISLTALQDQMPEPPVMDRSQFLNLAAMFEGALVVIAMILGWLTGVDPFGSLTWNWFAVGWGLICVFPMLVTFFTLYLIPWAPLRKIREFLLDTLGPLLDQCRWFDLILLALLAGVTEEVLFRGALQPIFAQGFASIDVPVSATASSIVCVNILFGMAHFITPLYGVLAGLMGAFLSGVQQFESQGNLLAPIVTHAAYDWIAFVIVVREYRQRDRSAAA